MSSIFYINEKSKVLLKTALAIARTLKLRNNAKTYTKKSIEDVYVRL